MPPDLFRTFDSFVGMDELLNNEDHRIAGGLFFDLTKCFYKIGGLLVGSFFVGSEGFKVCGVEEVVSVYVKRLAYVKEARRTDTVLTAFIFIELLM